MERTVERSHTHRRDNVNNMQCWIYSHLYRWKIEEQSKRIHEKLIGDFSRKTSLGRLHLRLWLGRSTNGPRGRGRDLASVGADRRLHLAS